MSDSYFGWELLYSSVESSISKKEDVIIAFVHYILIKHGFRCFGFDGEENPDHQDGTELLPRNWNQKENLNLKYKISDRNYVLQVTKSEGNIIFNLLNPAKVEASSAVFQIESSVAAIKGPLKSLIPNHSEIWSTIEDRILKPIVPETIGKASIAIQASEEKKSSIESFTPPNPRPFAQRHPDTEEYFDPFGVGRSDLDPLGNLGGGNLFQPPRRVDVNPGLGVPGGLPRSAVPPGARFDPFGPPDVNRPGRGGFGGRGGLGGGPGGFGRLSNPDHDHLPPPGFDDMFM